MKDKIQQFLNSEKVLLTSRLLLGSILIAASLGKIANPGDFINLVTSYNILPESLAQPFGVFLPWIELIIGSLLILGIFLRLASGISIMLVTSFIIANSYSLFNGAEASCGCFGGAMPLNYVQSLLIDGTMLLMTVPLLLHRNESWLAVSRSSAIRAFYATIAILLVLGSFLPRATSAIATVNIDETPVTLSRQAALNTGSCGNVVGEEADNTIKVGLNASYGQVPIDQRISKSLQARDAVFLFFYADWCGFCKKEKPIIDTLEQQYSKQISFLRLNNEKEAEAFKKFGITGFPTMYLITGINNNGDFLSQQFVGYTDEAKLKASFDQIISDGDAPYQGSVSATLAPHAYDSPLVPVLNNGPVSCFGTLSTDPNVCGGHGQCVAQDTCTCDQGYIGSQCQDTVSISCFGIPSTEPNVCGGHGQCVAQDTCTCDQGYSGDQCDITTCYGISSQDAQVCGAHGTCVAKDTCTCAEGYTSSQCELAISAGDANDDGQLNAQDITAVERIVAGIDTETYGADANQDGEMNALDITKTERLVARLD